MELTNLTIFESIESLKVLSNCKLPIKAAFKISRVIKVVEDISKDIDSARQKLIDKFGSKLEDGSLDISADGRVTITNVAEYNKEWDELMHVTNKVEVDRMDLELLGPVSIEPKHLYKLDWLFSD